MAPIKLTRTERCIPANQWRMLEALIPRCGSGRGSSGGSTS